MFRGGLSPVLLLLSGDPLNFYLLPNASLSRDSIAPFCYPEVRITYPVYVGNF